MGGESHNMNMVIYRYVGNLDMIRMNQHTKKEEEKDGDYAFFWMRGTKSKIRQCDLLNRLLYRQIRMDCGYEMHR